MLTLGVIQTTDAYRVVRDNRQLILSRELRVYTQPGYSNFSLQFPFAISIATSLCNFRLQLPLATFVCNFRLQLSFTTSLCNFLYVVKGLVDIHPNNK